MINHQCFKCVLVVHHAENGTCTNHTDGHCQGLRREFMCFFMYVVIWQPDCRDKAFLTLLFILPLNHLFNVFVSYTFSAFSRCIYVQNDLRYSSSIYWGHWWLRAFLKGLTAAVVGPEPVMNTPVSWTLDYDLPVLPPVLVFGGLKINFQ